MKVLIADDHWIVRESLKQVVKRLHQELDVLEAATFEEAIHTLSRHPDTDLMLIDLIMPGFDEFDGLARLRARFPEVPVVVVSVHEDVEHILRSVEQGVIGYIPKSAGGPEVERAIERVLAGEVWFPRRIIERSGKGASLGPRGTGEAGQSGRETEVLTKREYEVLMLLGQGLSVQRIAVELTLSAHTVRVHIGNLMKKLDLHDRSSTIRYAVMMTQGAPIARWTAAPLERSALLDRTDASNVLRQLDGAAVGLAVWSPAQALQYANRAFRDLFHATRRHYRARARIQGFRCSRGGIERMAAGPGRGDVERRRDRDLRLRQDE